MIDKKLFLGIILLSSLSGCMRTNFIETSKEAFITIQQGYYAEHQIFTISQNKLSIYRIILGSNNGELSTIKKRIFTRRISSEQLKTTLNHLENLTVLENYYDTGAVGGISWIIKISNPTKKIIIWNEELPQVKELFDFINSLIPKNKQRLII